MADNEAVDFEALSDLQTPWCLHTVVTLRIAEHIDAGTQEIGELATAAGCHRDALHRVLGHLVTKGVFAEPSPGRFALNSAGEALLDPAQRVGLDLTGIGGRMAYSWSTLPSYVRTGEPGYADLFGLPFWDDLDANPRLAESFDALIGPTGHGTPIAEFELTCGWSGVESVVDVGGGTGAMLAELLRLHPGVRGTLVDLPRVTPSAAPADVSFVAQSFFDPLPGGADLYLLRKVLNDWSERDTLAILIRCAEALSSSKPDARLVVIGGVVPDGTPKRLVIENVLLGGSIDGLTDFAQLAEKARLEVVDGRRQPAGYVVELRRAA